MHLCCVKRLIIYMVSALLLHATTSAVAQDTVHKSSLRFTSYSVDYGHIAEDGGSVVRNFQAVNNGAKPIVVVDVVTACGCTTASYSRKPIAPGESFNLEVRYNPMNRPGRIDRKIYVQTSDAEQRIALHLKGYVEARERDISELYPFDMGNGLRLDMTSHAFGNIEQGTTVESHIAYVNTSSEEVTLDIRPSKSSGWLNITYPQHIAAGGKGDIVMVYSPAIDEHNYGSLYDNLTIVVNGKVSRFPITTYAIVTDNFENMDDISSPRANISKKTIKFGVVKCNTTTLEQSFVLQNIGGSPLVVRAVESDNSAVRCSLKADTRVGVDESIEVKVWLDTEHIDPDKPLAARIQMVINGLLRPVNIVRVTALPE